MVGPFAVEGYDVLAPLDSAGRRWRAICLADGQPVVLRRWTGAAARKGEVRRGAALWGSVAGDGVVTVRDVVVDGADLVVMSETAGNPLDLLVKRWGLLSPGQVVTLAVGVAHVLGSAHERGLAHGRLDASSVVVDLDGRPRLTDYLFGEGSDAGADLAALVTLASGLLDSEAPAELVAALERAVDVADLAARVLAAVPAEPLTARIAEPAIVTPPGPGRESRVRIAAGVTVAAAVVATAMGMWWGRQEPAAGAPVAPVPPRVTPTQMSSPQSVPPPLSLTDVARDLDRRRVRAIARADAVALAHVEVGATALWRQDSRQIAQLADEHAHLRGLRVRVTAARVITVQAGQAVVRVVDALSSYDVVNADGHALEHGRRRPAQAVVLVLVRDGSSWRIRTARSVSR